jgi:thioredoxin 1
MVVFRTLYFLSILNLLALPTGVTMDVLLVLILVMLVLSRMFIPWYTAWKARGNDAQPLKTLLGIDDGRYLVLFWSPSCGQCRTMSALVDELSERRNDVRSVDLSEHRDLARELGVMATPAFVVIEKGTVRQIQLGARTQAQLLKLLEQAE